MKFRNRIPPKRNRRADIHHEGEAQPSLACGLLDNPPHSLSSAMVLTVADSAITRRVGEGYRFLRGRIARAISRECGRAAAAGTLTAVAPPAAAPSRVPAASGVLTSRPRVAVPPARSA
jgi:hypothetical protein